MMFDEDLKEAVRDTLKYAADNNMDLKLEIKEYGWGTIMIAWTEDGDTEMLTVTEFEERIANL